jgi:hypothetical protein
MAFRLSKVALQRLGVICSMEQVSRNDWLEAAIREKAKRWVVSDRASHESSAACENETAP